MKGWRWILGGGLLIIGVIVFVWGGTSPRPIQIGFAGSLTGRISDLSIDSRDGVMLAVEETNRAGGIHGRPVKLIVKDDHNNAHEAIRVDRELISQGVSAIIGHVTSSMTVAALPQINAARMLLISPTATNPRISGLDDYFIRVIPDLADTASLQADYARRKLHLRRIAILYDMSNAEYAMQWTTYFKFRFEKLGGRVIDIDRFHTNREADFWDTIQAMLAGHPDGVLIVAGAVDSALFSQQVRMQNDHIPILSSGWAMTPDFINHGGPAAEGVVFAHPADLESRSSNYLKFKQAFYKRFGRLPGYAAAYGYEAVRVLFRGLAAGRRPEEIKQAIINHRVFDGLWGHFVIDENGDTINESNIITVQNGKFVKVDWKDEQ
ncbi:Hypothetical protein LUCI_0627 [Lucifera butyrica]|uniref:Leucine-binding protein domain-containing protein n=1 Tax=Lucifera butyrica TaxID=1351585 RepID=A0A498R8F1_9FIRM|nr:ABC transporter substrate-binding protein [Lucifera butyrica]VBB05418.1 Hypothetical protein LUCI_0627 [Lucifera butyrica]